MNCSEFKLSCETSTKDLEKQESKVDIEHGLNTIDLEPTNPDIIHVKRIKRKRFPKNLGKLLIRMYTMARDPTDQSKETSNMLIHDLETTSNETDLVIMSSSNATTVPSNKFLYDYKSFSEKMSSSNVTNVTKFEPVLSNKLLHDYELLSEKSIIIEGDLNFSIQ